MTSRELSIKRVERINNKNESKSKVNWKRMGFEPMVCDLPYMNLADSHLKPLSHLFFFDLKTFVQVEMST